MKMQWDKVPERLHSESLKCLLCRVMARILEKTDDNYKVSLTLCCSLMIVVLTMDDDEAFESEAKLRQSLSCKKDLQNPLSEDEAAFVNQHTEYFFECTSRVLKSINNCPDKPYNSKEE